MVVLLFEMDSLLGYYLQQQPRYIEDSMLKVMVVVLLFNGRIVVIIFTVGRLSCCINNCDPVS